MIIAITGHRPNKLNNEYDLNGPCSSYIRDSIREILLREQPDKIISGMALGVDTIFALMGMELKIPVIAAVPFLKQESKWPYRSQVLYNKILNDPFVETYVVCEGGYAPEKMQIRNEWMVDNSDKLIAVYDGTRGGTGNCVEYARSQNKDMLYINPRGYLNVSSDSPHNDSID